MNSQTSKALLAGMTLALVLAVDAAPVLAQDTGRVGNYSYMRDRRRGADPRYQNPGTVYREEYKVDRSGPVYPAGPNDPRFQKGNNPNYDNPYLDPRDRNAYRYDPRAWVNQRYDANGQPITPIYDANGNIVGYPNVPTYDAEGRLINQPSQPVYDANGNLIGYPDAPMIDVNGNPIATPTSPGGRPQVRNGSPSVLPRSSSGQPGVAEPEDKVLKVGPFRIRY